MLTTRRRFLQATLGTSALVSTGLSVPGFVARSARAAAAAGQPGERILVVVQLSGGNDGLNTVIPYADEAYAKNRVALRIGADQALKVDDRLAFHPALSGFSKLLEESRLAIVQGIGYPNPDRSHFRSMDIWHTAKPEVEDTSDGWLGRSLDRPERGAGRDVPALHLGPQKLPLALLSRGTPVPSIESLESFRLQNANGALPLATLRQLADAPRGEKPSELLDFIRRGTLNAYVSSEQVQQALADDKAASPYPASALAQRLRSVAQLIDAGLATQIYYVELDGFDTHAKQLDAHAALLGELSGAVEAFVHDLAARGHLDRVAVLSFSEFGRRVAENASQGTDHGAAAPLFLAGGKIVSGVLGAHPSLTDLDQEGDMKFHTDFRRVYATLLDRWLNIPSEQVLGKRFEPLNIVTA